MFNARTRYLGLRFQCCVQKARCSSDIVEVVANGSTVDEDVIRIGVIELVLSIVGDLIKLRYVK